MYICFNKTIPFRLLNCFLHRSGDKKRIYNKRFEDKICLYILTQRQMFALSINFDCHFEIQNQTENLNNKTISFNYSENFLEVFFLGFVLFTVILAHKMKLFLLTLQINE